MYLDDVPGAATESAVAPAIHPPREFHAITLADYMKFHRGATSTWTNRSLHHAAFRVNVAGEFRDRAKKWVLVDIAPGASVVLPKAWDNSVQTLRRDSAHGFVITGGHDACGRLLNTERSYPVDIASRQSRGVKWT